MLQAVFLYFSGNYKAIAVWGDERGGQPDTSIGMPTEGVNFVGNCGPHFSLCNLKLGENFFVYNPKGYFGSWDMTMG